MSDKDKFNPPVRVSHQRSSDMFNSLGFGLVLLALGWRAWGWFFLGLAIALFVADLIVHIIRKVTE